MEYYNQDFLKLLEEIKKDARDLLLICETKEEEEQRKDLENIFCKRSEIMVIGFLYHLEKYQIKGWRELIFKGKEHE